MYPGMAKTAREEGFTEIADWFETLAKAEKSHAGRFGKAADSLTASSLVAVYGAPRSFASSNGRHRTRWASPGVDAQRHQPSVTCTLMP